MSRRTAPDPLTTEALAARDRARAAERAALAAGPANKWLERDKFTCQARESEPRARPEKRGRGRSRAA